MTLMFRSSEPLQFDEIDMIAKVLGFAHAIDLANFARSIERKCQPPEGSQLPQPTALPQPVAVNPRSMSTSRGSRKRRGSGYVEKAKLRTRESARQVRAT